MSARAVLQAALVAQLQGALGDTAVFDAPPVRGALPQAVVGEPVLADWSTKDWTGREGRVAVTIADGGERPVRVRALADAAEAAVAAMPAELGKGWRLVRATLVRSRLVRAGERWSATLEFLVRMYRAEG